MPSTFLFVAEVAPGERLAAFVEDFDEVRFALEQNLLKNC